MFVPSWRQTTLVTSRAPASRSPVRLLKPQSAPVDSEAGVHNLGSHLGGGAGGAACRGTPAVGLCICMGPMVECVGKPMHNRGLKPCSVDQWTSGPQTCSTNVPS